MWRISQQEWNWIEWGKKKGGKKRESLKRGKAEGDTRFLEMLWMSFWIPFIVSRDRPCWYISLRLNRIIFGKSRWAGEWKKECCPKLLLFFLCPSWDFYFYFILLFFFSNSFLARQAETQTNTWAYTVKKYNKIKKNDDIWWICKAGKQHTFNVCTSLHLWVFIFTPVPGPKEERIK